MTAGLPNISVEDHKLAYTVSGFKDDECEQLSYSDKKFLDIYFLKYDNDNLLQFLKDKDQKLDERGNIAPEEFELIVKSLHDGDSLPKGFSAPYFLDFEHIALPYRAKKGMNITQMYYAKQGIITPEMEYVAIRENMNCKELGIDTHITPEFVRQDPLSSIRYLVAI